MRNLKVMTIGGCMTALTPFLLVGQGLEHSAWAEVSQAVIQDSLQLAQSEMAEPTVETNAGNPLDASWEPGSYTNNFFGFTLQFPETWAIAPQETTQYLQEVGLNLLAGEDDALRTTAELALQNSYIMLMVSQAPLGSPVESNPSIIVMSERLPPLPGIETGADYLFQVGQLLSLSQVQYTIVSEPYSVQIGNKTFYRLDTSPDGGSFIQSYLTTLDLGYALTLILSGQEQEMAELEAIAASMQFQ
jgi:hypothetical protein